MWGDRVGVVVGSVGWPWRTAQCEWVRGRGLVALVARESVGWAAGAGPLGGSRGLA